MEDTLIYLDTYVLQQDMRVRLPKSILSNMPAEKGKTKFDIFFDSKEKALIFKRKEVTRMNNTFTAVSLFTGAGGMDVGFERAGINIMFANEMMSEAAQTYSANHPDGIMVNDDIHN